MAAGADAQPRRHRVFHPEQLHQKRRRQVAQNAGDDDRRHRDGDDAAMAFRHSRGNGRRDGLGQQGHRHGFIQPKQAAHHQDAADGSQRTGQAPRQYRQPILFQQVDLGIDRDRHTGRGRPQEKIDKAAALIIILIGNMEHRQNGNQQGHCDDHAVADHKARLFLGLDADPVGRHRQRDAKKGGGGQSAHFAAPFRFSSRRQVRRTAHTVAAKASTMESTQITRNAAALSRITST